MVLRIEKLSQFSRSKKQPLHPPIAQERESTLKELGGYLRQTRLQQSLSLDEIGIKTMIPVRLLQAIEEGRIDRLPEPVYIQAFLRRYADALGVNGVEFSSSFPTTSAATTAPQETLWSGLSLFHLQPVHLYLLYLGLIIVAVSSLSAQFNSAPSLVPAPGSESVSPPAPSAKNPSKPLGPERIPTTPATTAATVSKADKAAPTPATNVSGVNAKVTLKTESWLQVNADGTSVYEGILPAGTEKTWQAKQALEISAGNAGGVLVSVNGNPPKPIGADGAVESATFEAQDAAQTPKSP